MKTPVFRLVAGLLAVAAVQTACYNRYRISTDELTKLDSAHISKEVVVTDSTGQSVTVGSTTPIRVLTQSGETYSVTPFNFALTDSQLVAPDYDLLLARSNVREAEVAQFAAGKTWGLVAGGIAAAVGSFVLITVVAGSDSGPGGQ
jgi:hypothetical protein